MDESEFRRCLQLFPVVRSRDYHMDLDGSRQSTSLSAQTEVEWEDAWDGDNDREAFWDKLKLAATEKMGPAEAERFCKAFQRVYNKLVYEELTLDAARKFVNSSGSSGK
ncbi:uncharacterized protein LOC111383567 isoform X1 [Olea europaea var. sylvestris]|uniref:uncharacterized protein LOC111383567 isoform X1 n=1 Tax=Olea europaea var. sylvestris TaxID=158386 RepID=UPI000C1D39E1|nr:uncharacterized protein LOC111383567 isoform X1 [Olea europaea var. sylvestris]